MKKLFAVLGVILLLVIIDRVEGQELPGITATSSREAFEDVVRDIVDEAILDIRYDAPLWGTSDHPELRVEIIAPISKTISFGLGYRAGSYGEVLALGPKIVYNKRDYGMVTLRARVRLGEL